MKLFTNKAENNVPANFEYFEGFGGNPDLDKTGIQLKDIQAYDNEGGFTIVKGFTKNGYERSAAMSKQQADKLIEDYEAGVPVYLYNSISVISFFNQENLKRFNTLKTGGTLNPLELAAFKKYVDNKTFKKYNDAKTSLLSESVEINGLVFELKSTTKIIADHNPPTLYNFNNAVKDLKKFFELSQKAIELNYNFYKNHLTSGLNSVFSWSSKVNSLVSNHC